MSKEITKDQNTFWSNPEDNGIKDKQGNQLECYQLHQSFFTKQQLTSQAGFKIIHYSSPQNPHSIEPIVHSQNGSKINSTNLLYMGGIHMGLFHGWGVLISKKTTYQGNFSLGHKMGKGYMKFNNNNSVFIGDFVNDRPHGHGIMQLQDEYFIGDFQNGSMQGDGLWKNSKGQKYVGSWNSNKAHGFGIYSTQKSHYQGQFNHFVKHGYGIQNFPNGDAYKGHYVHGKPHGKGQYIWGNGSVYKGEFANGVRQGEGVWIAQNGDKYIGNFSNDRKNGPGQYYWSNGNIYKGNFSEDMREGQGQMLWVDGSEYLGQWKCGLPNGKGTFKVKGEKPRVGYFEDNVLVKQSHKQSRVSHSQQKLISHHDSLILSMIPQIPNKLRGKKQREVENKSLSKLMSTSETTRLFGQTTKVRTWKSRNRKR